MSWGDEFVNRYEELPKKRRYRIVKKADKKPKVKKATNIDIRVYTNPNVVAFPLSVSVHMIRGVKGLYINIFVFEILIRAKKVKV